MYTKKLSTETYTILTGQSDVPVEHCH
jgi:hypothetical protein